jgi:hypothetical protein
MEAHEEKARGSLHSAVSHEGEEYAFGEKLSSFLLVLSEKARGLSI